MRTLSCGIGVVSLLLLGGRLLAQGNRTAGAPVALSEQAFACGLLRDLDLGNAHGTDERLPVEAFGQGVEFLYRLLKSLTGGDPVENR